MHRQLSSYKGIPSIIPSILHMCILYGLFILREYGLSSECTPSNVHEGCYRPCNVAAVCYMQYGSYLFVTKSVTVFL